MPTDTMLEALKRDLETHSFQLRYRDRKGEVSNRLVTPLSICMHKDAWGVVAWCHVREDVRWFRVENIQHIDPVPRAREFGIQEIIRLVAGLGPSTCEAINRATKDEEQRGHAENPQAKSYYIFPEKVYVHEGCGRCTFLAHIVEKGSIKGRGRNDYDLYHCSADGAVVVRYAGGSDDYVVEHAEADAMKQRVDYDPLKIAYEMAKRKGLC